MNTSFIHKHALVTAKAKEEKELMAQEIRDLKQQLAKVSSLSADMLSLGEKLLASCQEVDSGLSEKRAREDENETTDCPRPLASARVRLEQGSF